MRSFERRKAVPAFLNLEHLIRLRVIYLNAGCSSDCDRIAVIVV